MRLVVFFAAIAVSLVGLVGLNWWVDPLADRYRGDVVARAFAHRPACAVSTNVLAESTWPAFKLDLFRRRRASTVVVGTSRVWKIGAHPHELRFVNAILPGMSVDAVPILFRRLHELAPARRLVAYLGVEPFWFTTSSSSSSFAKPSVRERLRLLGAAETLRATLRELVANPNQLVRPASRRNPELVGSSRRCLLDERDARRGSANAWGMDGTFLYAYELNGTRPARKDFLRADFGRMRGSSLAPNALASVGEALAFARAQRWRVIGFTAPFSHETIVRVENDPGGARLLRLYRKRLPRIFAAYGYPYLDLSDGRTVPCGADEFLRHDGAHANAACAAKVRRLLDTLAT